MSALPPNPMGSEAKTTLTIGRKKVDGIAQIEGGMLHFKGGELRLKVPRSAFEDATVEGDVLAFAYQDERYRLHLGERASKWLDKILNPPTLIDKLGIKAGMRVWVSGVDDADFFKALLARVGSVDARLKNDTDVIVFGASTPRDLDRLVALRKALKPAGAIWVVHSKGKGATLKDVEVFAAGKRAGLVDNKVAAFSLTHTAERLVIPLASRPKP